MIDGCVSKFAVISLSLHFCIISKNSFWVSRGKTGSRCIKSYGDNCAPSVFLKSGTTLVDKVYMTVFIVFLARGRWDWAFVFSVPEESLRRYQPLKEIWMVDKARELAVELVAVPSYIRIFGITGESRSLYVVCTLAKVRQWVMMMRWRWWWRWWWCVWMDRSSRQNFKLWKRWCCTSWKKWKYEVYENFLIFWWAFS